MFKKKFKSNYGNYHRRTINQSHKFCVTRATVHPVCVISRAINNCLAINKIKIIDSCDGIHKRFRILYHSSAIRLQRLVKCGNLGGTRTYTNDHFAPINTISYIYRPSITNTYTFLRFRTIFHLLTILLDSHCSESWFWGVLRFVQNCSRLWK